MPLGGSRLKVPRRMRVKSPPPQWSVCRTSISLPSERSAKYAGFGLVTPPLRMNLVRCVPAPSEEERCLTNQRGMVDKGIPDLVRFLLLPASLERHGTPPSPSSPHGVCSVPSQGHPHPSGSREGNLRSRTLTSCRHGRRCSPRRSSQRLTHQPWDR